MPNRSKAWPKYERLLTEMEEKRGIRELTEDEEHRYMNILGKLYPHLTLDEHGKAAELAVYFANRRRSRRGDA